MTGLIRKLLGMAGIRGMGRGTADHRLMRLPGEIREPRGLVVYSGPMVSDVWPALYTVNSLQKAFRKMELVVIAPKRDDRLFNMLGCRPDVHCYAERPELPRDPGTGKIPEGALLFYPYSKVIESDRKLLEEIPCPIRIAPLDDPSPLINLTVRTASPHFPEKLQQMFRTLGIDYDDEWRPEVQRHAVHAAQQRMAPVTGRMMPYIVTTDPALAILERSRAEIPLRTVSLSGKKSELADLDREIRTAVVAGARAVATDSDDLWGDACAFDVPVVGLDTGGDFMKWHGREAAHSREDFVQAWVELLKKGW